MKTKLQVISKPLLIVLTGATASGKTAIAKELYSTNKYEIISADSRQLYRGLDIGTGKDKSFLQAMINVADPPQTTSGQLFNAVEYRNMALPIINEIIVRKKIPVIVGGTGFYIESIIYKQSTGAVGADSGLRKEIEYLSNTQLLKEIEQKDPRTYKQIDHKNRVRLLRAVEIIRITREPIKLLHRQLRGDFDIHTFVIDVPRDELYKRIDARVDERLKQGMVEEVKGLLKDGVSADWLISLGLEYRYITQHLQGHIEYSEMVQKLKYAIHAYARRQITFFKRWPNTNWIAVEEVKDAILSLRS